MMKGATTVIIMRYMNENSFMTFILLQIIYGKISITFVVYECSPISHVWDPSIYLITLFDSQIINTQGQWKL